MTYKVIDNFLPAEVFERYHRILLTSGQIPMFYNAFVANESDNNTYYFTHLLYDKFRPTSDFYDLLAIPLFEKLEADHGLKAPILSKINWYPNTSEIIEHGKHIDCPRMDHNVCVFYPNDCNGFTRLGDDIVVESVANRALIFDGGIHNSSTCTDADMRCSINIDFI